MKIQLVFSQAGRQKMFSKCHSIRQNFVMLKMQMLKVNSTFKDCGLLHSALRNLIKTDHVKIMQQATVDYNDLPLLFP